MLSIELKCLHSSIVICFETITAEGSHKWSSDSLTDAHTLLLAITTANFISALVITNECLHFFLGLTRSLQQEAKDIVHAVSEVETLTLSLKKVRKNVDIHHNEWFETVSEMCSEVGTTPLIPRTCGRQHHRTNTPASTPSEYFRRTITVLILDHFLVELDRRPKHPSPCNCPLYSPCDFLQCRTIFQWAQAHQNCSSV